MQEYQVTGNRVMESLMMERRITLRLLGYWEKLRGMRTMPASDEINPDDIQDLWDNCLLVQVSDLDKADYQYTYLGSAISEAYRSGSDNGEGGRPALDTSSLAAGYRKVVETGKPLLDEGEFYNPNNHLVKYRLCLLPLGEGEQVRAIFGGMRFKIYTS
jgi:hypothetical protein